MNHQALSFFETNGYLILDNPLSSVEVVRYRELYDRDREENAFNWRLIGPRGHQTVNCDALVTIPEIDALLRHPNVLRPVEALLGGPACLSEICLRHMGPYGPLEQRWHYYGHRAGPVLSHYSTIPARLWRDYPDEDVRGFYGNLNRKSVLFADALGEPTPAHEDSTDAHLL